MTVLTPVRQFLKQNKDLGSFASTDDFATSFEKEETAFVMPSGWKMLRYVQQQVAYYNSTARYNVVPAGRRAGKSEIAVRRAVIKAMQCKFDDGRVILAAPTHAQAKRIFWAKLKRLVPGKFVTNISESELSITLVNGCLLNVIGLDVPERVEGTPITHIDMDEYGNMHPDVWTEHVRPALSDHQGSADFTGVPEGRNHYYDLYTDAGAKDAWATFHWKSAAVLPASEIAAAKEDLDQLTFEQEYEGSFINFKGRMYYTFTDDNIKPTVYDANRELIFAFDFNKSPGVAAVIQEQDHTKILDEVNIPQHSNTELVCDELIRKWQHHSKIVRIYGDATGGQGGSAKIAGSDWDIVEAKLRKVFVLRTEVPDGNPPVVARVNATNSRIRTITGKIRLDVDPKCVHVIKDYEGVRQLDGASGKIDKKSDTKLSHISDAIGYYLHREFSTERHKVTVRQL